MKTLAGANIVSTLGLSTFGNGDGYVTEGALRAAAIASLLANPNTTSINATRTYQDCLKSLLDAINNNGNPPGSSAYPGGPVTIVSSGQSSTCTVSY